jgi:ABC-type sugar transport system ATPase subunit
MSIFNTEKDKKEFVAAFRKLTMSGAVSQDVAIEKLIRNNPNYFHQQTADEAKKSFHAAMNDEMRARAQQSNRLSIDIFRRHADKQKPS